VTGGSVDVSTPSESRWASPSASAEAARRRIGTRGDEDLRTTTDPIRATHLETATRTPDRWWPNRRAPNDAMRISITASSRVPRQSFKTFEIVVHSTTLRSVVSSRSDFAPECRITTIQGHGTSVGYRRGLDGAHPFGHSGPRSSRRADPGCGSSSPDRSNSLWPEHSPLRHASSP
jgi:hypothetical protein